MPETTLEEVKEKQPDFYAFYGRFTIPFGPLKNVKAFNCNARLLKENGYKSSDFDAYPNCREALGDSIPLLKSWEEEEPVEEGDEGDEPAPAPSPAPKKGVRTKKKKS